MSDKKDLAALKATTQGMGEVGQGVSSLAELAPGTAGDVKDQLYSGISSSALKTANAPEWAAEAKAYGNNYHQKPPAKFVADTLSETVKDINIEGDASKRGALVSALSKATGISRDEVEADMNAAAQAHRVEVNSRATLGMFGGDSAEKHRAQDAQERIYNKYNAALEQAVGKAVDGASAALASDPMALELARGAKGGTPDPLREKDAKHLEQALADSKLDEKSRNAIATLAKASPDHAGSIAEKLEVLTLEKRENNQGVVATKSQELAKELTQAAEEAAQRSGGNDAAVVKALSDLTGKDAGELKKQLHTAAAAAERAEHKHGQTARGEEQNVSYSSDKRAEDEARQIQRQQEALLQDSIAKGVRGEREERKTAVTVAPPAKPQAQEGQLAEHKPEERTATKRKISNKRGVDFVGVKHDVDALELQKMLKKVDPNADLGGTGAKKDGVDGAWGEKSEAALRKFLDDHGKKGVDTSSADALSALVTAAGEKEIPILKHEVHKAAHKKKAQHEAGGAGGAPQEQQTSTQTTTAPTVTGDVIVDKTVLKGGRGTVAVTEADVKKEALALGVADGTTITPEVKERMDAALRQKFWTDHKDQMSHTRAGVQYPTTSEMSAQLEADKLGIKIDKDILGSRGIFSSDPKVTRELVVQEAKLTKMTGLIDENKLAEMEARIKKEYREQHPEGLVKTNPRGGLALPGLEKMVAALSADHQQGVNTTDYTPQNLVAAVQGAGTTKHR